MLFLCEFKDFKFSVFGVLYHATREILGTFETLFARKTP